MAKKSSQKLRNGFTTGTAATAAAKGALVHLLTGRTPDQVGVQLLNNHNLGIAIHACTPVDSNTTLCSVIKDAGDDPDITHKAEIGAKVRIQRDARAIKIKITGGRGVGIVTKPGLSTPPGEPAITKGPRKMIIWAANQVLSEHHIRAEVTIEIFVPRGEALARKTLNARLGILGGISILGTTGVVKPMSHASYIATIDASLSVARAAGLRQVVLATGRRSERFAQVRWANLAPEGFIQMGDYFSKAMEMAAGHGFVEAIVAVFFGKAVKMAQGIAHTHARSARLTLDGLARWAMAETGNKALARRIIEANTARQVFDFIKEDHPKIIHRVGREIVRVAHDFSENKVTVRVVIFDFEEGLSFDSANA